MKFYQNKYFLILLLILFFVFWIWWLPGPRVAGDFSFISNDWLKLQFDIPRVWTERGADGLGEYSFFLLGSWPISFIFGLLANLGMTFEIWERILIVLFLLFGSISIWKLLSFYFLPPQARFIGSLFYLINTYAVLLIDGGQIYIAIAYALFPLAFLMLLKAVHTNLINKIFAGLLFALVGFFDVRFVYILFLLLLIRACSDLLVYRKTTDTNIEQWFSSAIFIGLVVLGLNATWLVVQFKVPMSESIVTSLIQISTSFVNIGHPLLVIAPHWYQNIFGKVSPLKMEFILIPVLVFLAPILKRKNKDVAFWLFAAIISAFLAKGDSEPLSFVYGWLHTNIPGFSFFRDSSKFFFLVTFAYAVLIAFTSEELIKRFLKTRLLQVFYLVIISVYLLYLIRPIFLNQMRGTFSIPSFEAEFNSLSTVLQKDKTFGRTLWIPVTAPLTYYDLNHPVVEALRIYNKKPFVFGVKGTYELFNFLREASYVGQLFDVAGIAYIAYPIPDPKRENLSSDDIKYYYTFLNQLTKLSWIEKAIPDSRVSLLKTKSHQDKIFIASNIWVVFGSDEVLNEATKSAKLKLSNNTIILAEQKSGMGQFIAKNPEMKIVLNKKTEVDLLASFFPQSQLFFPGKEMSISPDKNGWWKNNGTDLISWRDFLQTKYGLDSKEFDLGGGWAVGEKNLEFRIKNEEFKKNNMLFARVMESSRSGDISFYQGDQLIGKINTKAMNTVVRWFEVGVLQKEMAITIVTNGDINVINALISVDPVQFAVYKEASNSLAKQIVEFKPENTSENNASITYQKINQTEYKIRVTNLAQPGFIIFSSEFHPLWKLNGENSTEVYGFLNGFRVDKDGEYVLKFEPQKYILPGFFLSGFTASLLLLYLVIIRKNAKRL